MVVRRKGVVPQVERVKNGVRVLQVPQPEKKVKKLKNITQTTESRTTLVAAVPFTSK